MSDEKQGDVSIGGLWVCTTPNGPVLTGSLGYANIAIWPNNRKREGKKDPDYFMKLSNKPKPQAESVPMNPFQRQEEHQYPEEQVPF